MPCPLSTCGQRLQWCGHCKKLEPEYAAAATELLGNDPPIRIAKVDATVSDKLASRFSVQGFPTLKFFRGGKDVEYSGGRTTKEIVSWVTKKSGPAFTEVSDVEAATAFKSKQSVTVFGFFSELSGPEFKAFEVAASAVDDAAFAVTTSEAVRAALEVSETGNAIVLFKDFDEGVVVFSGDKTDSDEVIGFVRDNRLPLVITFSQETAPLIFGGSVKTHVLMMADEDMDGFESIKASWTEAAKSHRGEALFIWVPPTEDRILSYFDVKEEDLPKTVIVSMPDGEAMKKFPVADEVGTDGAAIAEQLVKVLSGEIKPTLKSEEPEPSDTEGPVTVVRGKTFADIALDTNKDVLLEFYAPWCGHCKSLAPIYEELGEKYGSDKLVIAKIDATANEIEYEGVNVRGFPTLYFFPATTDGSAKVAKEFDGSRDLKGMVDFLNTHATTPISEAGSDKDEL